MQQLNIESLLLLDIETVSQYPLYEELPENWKKLWQEKVQHYLPESETASGYYPKRAAILAEFGKIICISMGYFKKENGVLQLRITSLFGDDEKLLLQQFLQMQQKLQTDKHPKIFCGHNVKEFDLPYICRRLLINGILIPTYLDFQSMKPWQTNIVDTMQLWRFGDYKNYITLNLLAACVGVASPKNDIDGSMVGEVYWQQKNLPRIVHYCEKDVVTVAQIILKMKGFNLLTADNIWVNNQKINMDFDG